MKRLNYNIVLFYTMAKKITLNKKMRKRKTRKMVKSGNGQEKYLIKKLDLSNQELTELPEDIHLYTLLEELNCNENQLTALPENLPASLIELSCNENQLTNLPNNLPASLIILQCNGNQLTALPEHLPDYIIILDCQTNQLTALPENLPASLEELFCNENQLTNLPNNLPASIKILECDSNQITALPENLPASLEYLICNGNQITALPENLPASLESLICNGNQITALPENLPASLEYLICNGNQLTTLPKSILTLNKLKYINFDLNYRININTIENLKKYFQSKISRTQTFYDPIMMEEVNIVNFVQSNPNNIVFYDKNNFYFLNKKQLIDLNNKEKKSNSLVYICKKVYNILNITENELKDKTPYFKLKSIGLYGGLVKSNKIEKIINDSHQYYVLEKTEETAPSVVNYTYYKSLITGNANAVSTSHCQEGQKETIYEIKKYNPEIIGGKKI
jgi:Leucine-rich repeat (LRR) protein